jgi:Tfp pilus assembly protein PilW
MSANHGVRYGRKGFSLIEMLFAFLIGMVIAGAIVSLVVSQIHLTATQNRNILNQESVRSTLRFVAEEIQLLGTAGDPPSLITAEASEMEFIGDFDGDSVPDKVNYNASGSLLQRTYFTTADGGQTWTQVATDTLLDNVSSFGFYYFAKGNVAPVTADEITAVEIRLTLNVAQNTTAFTGNRIANQSMVSRVTLRNRLL